MIDLHRNSDHPDSNLSTAYRCIGASSPRSAKEMNLHDYHLESYSVDCGEKSIHMRFSWPYDEKRESKEITFEGVAGYNFRDAVGCVIFDLEEKEMKAFLDEHASEFSTSYTSFGFPAFWRKDLQEALENLKAYRVWTIDSSIGFDGWVVARVLSEADPVAGINSVTSLRSSTT